MGILRAMRLVPSGRRDRREGGSGAFRVEAVALAVATAMVLALASTGHAQDRPTSGDMSILSGRTLGNGETVLAAGLGWPGIWAQVTLAPSSTFNLGVRATVLYGSPVMGLGSGVGGSLSVPMRLHLFGKDTLDLALTLEPGFALGEGALAGQETAFADNFGYAGWADVGALAGMQVSEAVTLTLGVLGEVAYVDVPDNDVDGRHLVGGVLGVLAVEALMSRDTMLFAELRGGWGFANERLFDGHEILRVSLGLAYLL